jgi:hypothetical protein
MLGRLNARRGAREGGFACLRLAFGLGLLALVQPLAFADEVGPPVASDRQGPKQPITAYNGSYTYSIPIETPAFRGIEPKLKLSYDSARGIRNAGSAGSWLGIGWKLDGVSAIERVSGSWAATAATKKTGGRGSPVYSDTEGAMPADAFTIDGDELVACSELGNTSPSCTASGAGTKYTGRIENYLRIRRNTSANTWEVTAKDGTLYSYASPAGGTFATTFRWSLASVTDRRGNHVDYAYDCSVTGAECIISTIQYFNQNAASSAIATISFTSKMRPASDELSYATGSAIVSNARRLKAIKVAFASGTVRAYALSYDASPSSGLSRLTSVQEYGRDAVVDSGGNLTGTALPATVMTYSNLDAATAYTTQSYSNPPGILGLNNETLMETGDFDGDGNTDFLYAVKEHDRIKPGEDWIDVYRCTLQVRGLTAYSSVTVWFENRWEELGDCSDELADGVMSGRDFNGDGQDDIVKITHGKYQWPQDQNPKYYPATLTPYYFNGTSFNVGGSIGGGADPSSYRKPFEGGIDGFGDYDGDGKVDFITQERHLWKGTASGFAYDQTWTVPENANDAGDLNGDGKSDAVVTETIIEGGDGTYGGGGTAKKQRTPYLSTGKSFAARTSVVTAQGAELSDQIVNRAGDVNGDGRSDLVKIRNYGPLNGYSENVLGVTVFLSTGTSYAPAGAESKFDGFGDLSRLFEVVSITDFDADGRADLRVGGFFFRSTGSTFVRSPDYPIVGGLSDPPGLTTEGNDDGHPDYYIFHYGIVDGQVKVVRYDTVFSNGEDADLLINVVEPLGGKIAVTYKPSTIATSTLLPFVMPVVKTITVDDGRGGTGSPVWSTTTSYDYAGGKWNADERQFMGFATVTATLPKIEGETASPKTVSTYQQSLPCLGKVVAIESFDQGGTRLRKVSSGITQNATSAPFTCQETTTTTADLPDTVNKRTRITRSFDGYDNVTRLTRNGEVGFTGDESNEATDFYANTSSYVVSCPAREITRTGADSSGTKLKETQHFYANNSDWALQPSRCEETQTKAWISGSNYAVSSAMFDAFGNLYQSFDALQHKTQHEYDQAYNLFEKKTKLPKYFDAPADTRFIILQDWDSNGNGTDDFRCEEPSRITGINGETT